MEKMDNENYLDENYSELKKIFSLWKTISGYEKYYQACYGSLAR